MATPNDCIFCAIVAGKAPAHRVHEDDRVLIFMDLFPVAEGHTLIIPKRHGATLFETEVEDLKAAIAHSKPLAEAIQREFAPAGIGVYQLNGAAAGQTVFHYHMHLIPRNQGDGLGIHGRRQEEAQVLANHAARLSKAFESAAGKR